MSSAIDCAHKALSMVLLKIEGTPWQCQVQQVEQRRYCRASWR